MNLRVYIASRSKHAPMWRTLRDAGWPISSSWIDEAGPGETSDWTAFWARALREAAEADALILYREDGEVLRGAYLELGAALAAGVPVWWVGPEDGSPSRNGAIRLAESVEDALREIELAVEHRHHMMQERLGRAELGGEAEELAS